MSNLSLRDIDGLVSELEENIVLGRKRLLEMWSGCVESWGRSCGGRRDRAGAGTEAETEAVLPAPQPGQTVADQHRVTLMKTDPHIDIAQSY